MFFNSKCNILNFEFFLLRSKKKMVKGTEKKLVSLTFPVYKFNTKQFIGTSFVQMKTGERYFAILNSTFF